MKLRSVKTLCWSLIAAGIAVLAALIMLYPDAPIQPPRTPVVTDISAVPYDCTSHLTDLATGEEWAVPAPCHRPVDGVCVRTGGSGPAFRAWAEPCTPAELVGCVGAVTVTITAGGVTASCVPDSGNPAVQS